MDAVKDFEADRKYGFAWNVLDNDDIEDIVLTLTRRTVVERLE